MEDYKISLVAKCDEAAVNDFLRDHFYSSEPLNSAIRRKFDALYPSGSPHFSHCTYANLANGLTVKAEDGDGNILGVAVNTAPIAGLSTGRFEIKGDRPLMDKIIEFLNFIDEQSKYDEILTRNDSRVIDIKLLSVSSAHRKKGIGARLIRETISIADSKNMALSVGCSSAYTSQIVEKFPQFRRVLSFPYNQYADSQGEAVFRVDHPHEVYNVFLYEK